MNSDAEGLFLVTACMMQSLFSRLGKKGLISEAEGADVIRAAERFLAGLNSSMMSEDGARTPIASSSRWKRLSAAAQIERSSWRQPATTSEGGNGR
jgi:hypothetical protein